MVKLKKGVCVSFVMLCLISIAPLMRYKISVRASSTTWTVDDNGPANFTKIQDAIYSDNVSSGDTIFVHNGTYTENIVVNKSLSLVAENVDLTIVNGNRSGNVVSINDTDNVSFTGFTVKNSGMYENYSGIYIERSSGTIISHNKITENANGISVYFSNSITISDNIISSSSLYHGIFLHSSGGCIITENLLSDNIIGIYVYSSSRNTISDNMIFDNFDGIDVHLSNDNAVSGNNISSSLANGISFYSSNNNTIYHNNFINLNIANQTSSDESANFWDYGGEGNYWIDYTGQDLNGDGLGDVPYVIDSNLRDNDPLMGAFSDFKVVFKGETYHVAVISNSTISELVFEIGLETRNKIIRFNATGASGTTGFCRIAVPTSLMQYPYILLVGSEEVTPTLIGNFETYVSFYLSYSQQNATIGIISSEALRLYNELLINYTRLQMDFYSLNSSFSGLLSIYDVLSENYSELQRSFGTLNESYQQIYSLNASYSELLNSYSTLRTDFDSLNASYVQLLNNYATLWTNLYSVNSSYSQLSTSYLALRTDYSNLNTSYYNLLNTQSILLENYTQLQTSYAELNNSYQQHLQNYSEQTQNIQSLIYIIIAIITVFIITTIYLSRQAYKVATPRNEAFSEEEE